MGELAIDGTREKRMFIGRKKGERLYSLPEYSRNAKIQRRGNI